MRKDYFGNTVTYGFIAALICAALSGITGISFLLWGAVLGVIPFCLASMMALFYALHSLFTGRR